MLKHYKLYFKNAKRGSRGRGNHTRIDKFASLDEDLSRMNLKEKVGLVLCL